MGNNRNVGVSDVVPFSDVQAASVERIKTGCAAWDEAFGGPDPGTVPGTAVLLAGLAGSGKSTLLIQMLSRYAAVTGKKAFLLSAEQSTPEVKISFDRLRIPNPEMILGLREYGPRAEVDESLFQTHPPCAIVVDSLTAMVGKDRQAMVAIGRVYKKYAVKYKAIVFLVTHATKAESVAGPETIIHDADVLAALEGPQDYGRERDPSRYFQGNFKKLVLYKNRFGATLKPYWFEMGERGLTEVPPDAKKEKRDAQEAGDVPVRDVNTVAGAVLHRTQLEAELAATITQMKADIKKAKAREVALATAEPEPPGTPDLGDLDDEDAALDEEPIDELEPPPRTRAAPREVPDAIELGGQRLVKKKPRSKAGLHLVTGTRRTTEGTVIP